MRSECGPEREREQGWIVWKAAHASMSPQSFRAARLARDNFGKPLPTCRGQRQMPCSAGPQKFPILLQRRDSPAKVGFTGRKADMAGANADTHSGCLESARRESFDATANPA